MTGMKQTEPERIMGPPTSSSGARLAAALAGETGSGSSIGTGSIKQDIVLI